MILTRAQNKLFCKQRCAAIWLLLWKPWCDFAHKPISIVTSENVVGQTELYICIYTYIYICIFIYCSPIPHNSEKFLSVSLSLSLSLILCVCVCMCVCIYIYTYIYSRTPLIRKLVIRIGLTLWVNL